MGCLLHTPSFKIFACDSVNHMGISNFFLLAVVVMRRDVERTMKITIFRGRAEKKNGFLCSQREREKAKRLASEYGLVS